MDAMEREQYLYARGAWMTS